MTHSDWDRRSPTAFSPIPFARLAAATLAVIACTLLTACGGTRRAYTGPERTSDQTAVLSVGKAPRPDDGGRPFTLAIRDWTYSASAEERLEIAPEWQEVRVAIHHRELVQQPGGAFYNPKQKVTRLLFRAEPGHRYVFDWNGDESDPIVWIRDETRAQDATPRLRLADGTVQ